MAMSFYEYLKQDAELPEELKERLLPRSFTIKTLNQLQAFAKQRWPSHFPAHWRDEDPPDARYGRSAMRELWSKYLQVSETTVEAE